MYVVEKLKGNRFQDVAIPKNRDYFRRMNGNYPVPPLSAYSEDATVPLGMNKTEILATAGYVDIQAIRREAAEARNAAQESTERDAGKSQK